jgi:hypothetical protein
MMKRSKCKTRKQNQRNLRNLESQQPQRRTRKTNNKETMMINRSKTQRMIKKTRMMKRTRMKMIMMRRMRKNLRRHHKNAIELLLRNLAEAFEQWKSV